MNPSGGLLTENNLYLILVGIYVLYLYVDSKFKGYIFIAVWAISIPFLGFIQTKPIKILIFMLLMGAVFIGGMVEADKFKKLGKDIYRPSKRNIVVAIFLVGVFMVVKSLFFTIEH